MQFLCSERNWFPNIFALLGGKSNLSILPKNSEILCYFCRHKTHNQFMLPPNQSNINITDLSQRVRYNKMTRKKLYIKNHKKWDLRNKQKNKQTIRWHIKLLLLFFLLTLFTVQKNNFVLEIFASSTVFSYSFERNI